MPTKKRLEKKKNIEKLKAAKGSKTIAQCFSYKQDEASNSQSSSLVENRYLFVFLDFYKSYNLALIMFSFHFSQ